MLALSVALMAEAKPLIHHFHLREEPNIKGYRIWKNHEMLLILTGSGKLFSAAASSYLLGRYPEISLFVNMGIAGHASLAVGSLILASKIIDSQENKSFYPTMIIDPPCRTMTVTTLPKPSKEYREETCFDMEASGFFLASSKFLPSECIHCLKIISDNATSSHFLVHEKIVSDMILAQSGLIETILKQMQGATERRQPIRTESLYLEQWHFTCSQKEKLADILYRIEALKPKETNEGFSHCKNAQEFLSLLEEKAKKLPIFCGIKKPVS